MTPPITERPAQHQGAEHAVDLAAALEFVNTGDRIPGVPTERLDTPGAAIDALVEIGALHQPVSPAGQRDLGRVRRARAALRELLDANAGHRAPGSDAVATAEELLGVRPAVAVRADAHGVWIGHRHGSDPLGEALAALASPIVEELARGRPERLRVCENPTCRWAFFDSSPTGRRRWCEMQSCGNRAKAARHRARRRAEQAMALVGSGTAGSGAAGSGAAESAAGSTGSGGSANGT
jgi:predicted RNA-binding Zn ribbon-like protein